MSIRRQVCKYNKMLPTLQLVTWTSGNISIADEKNLYIKPSGILFDDLTHKDISVVEIKTGNHLQGRKPSTDTESHRIVYKHKPHVKSIVHTHSTYATAFAACGKDIPVLLTAAADEFGQAIKCSDYAEIGGKEIGHEICKYMEPTGVVLLRNHGVFTTAKTVEEALKKAVMVEDVAKTTYHAHMLKTPIELTLEQIRNCYERYQNTYGQNNSNR
jgi:L-ribulose-5-phosphate 4-epimerase